MMLVSLTLVAVITVSIDSSPAVSRVSRSAPSPWRSSTFFSSWPSCSARLPVLLDELHLEGVLQKLRDTTANVSATDHHHPLTALRTHSHDQHQARYVLRAGQEIEVVVQSNLVVPTRNQRVPLASDRHDRKANPSRCREISLISRSSSAEVSPIRAPMTCMAPSASSNTLLPSAS